MGSLLRDFIVGFSKTRKGCESITTLVDRQSRRVYFITANGTDTTVNSANYFFKQIFKPHEFPDGILYKRDRKFGPVFCKRMMERKEIKLRMSSSPQP